MKSLRILLGLLCMSATTIAPNLPVRAAENATQKAGRAAITAIYRDMDRAVLKLDYSAMRKHLAPDFVHYERTPKGLEAYKGTQAIDRVQRMYGDLARKGVTMKYVKSETKILSLTWRGPDAIVETQSTGVATAQMNGRSTRIEVVNLCRDYWSRIGGQWKVRQSLDRGGKRWLNGRSVPSP